LYSHFHTGETDEDLLGLLLGQLDIKKAGIRGASNLPLDVCMRYRIKTGLWIKTNHLYGLPAVSKLMCMLPGSMSTAESSK